MPNALGILLGAAVNRVDRLEGLAARAKQRAVALNDSGLHVRCPKIDGKNRHRSHLMPCRAYPPPLDFGFRAFGEAEYSVVATHRLTAAQSLVEAPAPLGQHTRPRPWYICPCRPMHSPVDQSSVAARWRERGFSCDLWIDAPGQVWADYVHEVDELVMVVQGEVEFEIDGVVYRPDLGEELLIPARANHTVRNIGGTESRWLYGYKR